MSIFSSPGWSEAGGPWVKPDEAMKKLVWSETDVEGPRSIRDKLPDPPSNEGPVRDSQRRRASGRAALLSRLSSSSPTARQLTKRRWPRCIPKSPPTTVPIDDAATARRQSQHRNQHRSAAPDGGPAWLQYEFAKPFTARALSLGAHGRIPVGRVLASDDGVLSARSPSCPARRAITARPSAPSPSLPSRRNSSASNSTAPACSPLPSSTEACPFPPRNTPSPKPSSTPTRA